MNGKKSFHLLTLFVAVCLLLVSHSASARDGKLNIAIPQEPTTMDPSLVITGPDFAVIENWGEYLISITPGGDLKPGLATSWKISPDGKEIEFALRKGVKFHSGDLLTSKDVVFSFERGKTKNSSVKSRLTTLDRIEVMDDYRFKMHFKAPDVTFIPNRGHAAIVSKSYYDRVGENKFVKEPVGTGPYKLASYVPGEYFDLGRFEDYWGEKPVVKDARFYFVADDTTRVAKIKAGEVDMISNCPYPLVKDLEKTRGLKMIKLATNHPAIVIAFSTQNPRVPWHDKRVRLAMAYAIDCDIINKNVLHGLPNRWAFLAPYELGFDPDIKPYPYDPKKSRDLLAEAGYPKGFDFRLYYPTGGRVPMGKEIVEAIAAYFEAVGIRTKLVGEEFATFQSRRRASKGPEAEFVYFSALTMSGGPEPTYFMTQGFTKEGGTSVYYNPEIEKIVFEARATVNDSKRAELIRRAVKVMHEEVPAIPIFNTIIVYVASENIDFRPTRYYNDMVLVKDISIK
jgi:peptide/nickel transport system substrate-binding protein